MAVFRALDALPVFRKPVLTIGTFDGVHEGHRVILQRMVQRAKALGGESIVITFHPHPRQLLRPDEPLPILTPPEEKIALLQANGIDHVVIVPFTREFAAQSAEAYVKDFLIKQFRPSVIIIGYDHHFGARRDGNIELLRSHADEGGFIIEEIPAQEIDAAAISSTKIRAAIQQGDVTAAAAMLGRMYSLKGTVIKGQQLGRTIGYPTANIIPVDKEQLLPATGVYAVQVNIGGVLYGAMLNSGFRPTVSGDRQVHTEAHLFNFSGDLYDKVIEILFVQRLRDEQRFSGIDALKIQLAKDKDAAINVLNP